MPTRNLVVRNLASARALASARGLVTLKNPLVVVGANTASNQLSAYPWTGAFGTILTYPVSGGGAGNNMMAFSPSGKFVTNTGTYLAAVYTNGGLGGLILWPMSPAGFGTAIKANVGSNNAAVAWSPDGRYVGVVGSTSPFVKVYSVSAGAIGSAVSDPATLPAGNAKGIAWSPNGNYLLVSHNTTPFFRLYNWSNGFGSEIVNAIPPTTPTAMLGVAWHPSGNYFIITFSNTTPFYVVYPFFNGVIGPALTGGVALSGASNANKGNVVFSPNGSFISFAISTSPFIQTVRWKQSGGLAASVLANPATLPTGGGQQIAYSPDGLYLGLAHAITPFCSIYPWSGDGTYGTKVSDPGVLSVGDSQGFAFNR